MRLFEQAGKLGVTQYWSRAYALLLFAWLPIGMLEMIDGLLMFMSVPELISQVPLLVVFVACLAAPLGLAALLVVAVLRLAPLAEGLRAQVGWAVALAPAAMLTVVQWLKAARDWTSSVLGVPFIPPPWMKLVGVIALLGILVWILTSGKAASWVGRIGQIGKGPVRVALWMLVAAFGWILVAAIVHPSRTPGAPSSQLAAKPDVIFISIDAASALDADWCDDQLNPLMPNMQALARDATCFSRAYSVSNYTTPTTATLETGLLPWTHSNVQIAAKLPAPLRDLTLAQTLRSHGWQTFNVTDNINATPQQRGSWRGWDHVRFFHSVPIDFVRGGLLKLLPDSHLPMISNSLLSLVRAASLYRSENPYRPEPLFNELLVWLDAHPTPVFAWVHSMPPHDPYLPPPSTRYKLLPPGELERWKDFMPQASPYPPDQQERVDKHRLRYRELLMSVDNALGGLMRELKARGRFDNALIIVSSDHGESFERGFLGHGGHALHEAVIRVPLLIKLPGQSSGRVISQAVSQVDIVPTIQDILGLKPLIATEGRSLKAGLESEALAPAPVFSMAMERQSRFEPLSNGRFAIVSEQHKLVLDLKSGSTELFDLQEDPGERTNLLQTRPERAKELRLQLDTALERAGRARNQALGQ